MRRTTAFRLSSTPCPVLAETGTASEASMPVMSSISRRARSGSAAGRSVLDRAGMISRFKSAAVLQAAMVWACTPWTASTSSSAPSQADRERDTS